MGAFLYVDVFTRVQTAVILFVFGTALLVLDLLRLRNPALNRVIIGVYGPLMREGEHDGPSAQLYYLLGLFWAVFALPKTVGVQAILTLAWLDPIAALFGGKFGRTQWAKFVPRAGEVVRNKTLEGSLAGFLAAFLAGVIAWTGPWAAVPMVGGLYWPTPFVIAALSISGGVAAVLAEALPSQWDDNATIPFWTGIVVWLVAAVIGVPMKF